MSVEILIRLPIIIFSLTVHEIAHGYVAYKMGDPTAKNLGRITLNPLAHLDLFGFLAFLFLPIGWAKPVPINPNNFKDYKRGVMYVSLAGPVSNLILAFIIAILFRKVVQPYFVINQMVELFFMTFIFLNVGLALFNMLPIPPLDGSKIFMGWLPHRVQTVINGSLSYSIIILIIAINILSRPLTLAIYFVANQIIRLVDLLPF